MRSKLQAVLRKYAEHRLILARSPVDEVTLQRELDAIHEMHGQMQALVQEGVDRGTPVVVPLVNNLNATTSSHTARLAAIRDRLPSSVLLLLGFAAVISMGLMGRQQGVAREANHGATLCFALLVALVVWVTLDLNQPQQGLITVSQEPLQQLLKGME